MASGPPAAGRLVCQERLLNCMPQALGWLPACLPPAGGPRSAWSMARAWACARWLTSPSTPAPPTPMPPAATPPPAWTTAAGAARPCTPAAASELSRPGSLPLRFRSSARLVLTPQPARSPLPARHPPPPQPGAPAARSASTTSASSPPTSPTPQTPRRSPTLWWRPARRRATSRGSASSWAPRCAPACAATWAAAPARCAARWARAPPTPRAT
jgi:hypothetical protein